MNMKLSIKTAFACAAVLFPALAFAQSGDTVTREQVRAQLEQLEQAGYNPLNGCSGDCPGSLRRSENVLAKQRANANAGYGPELNGTVQSGQ
jgi:hypothetical protein